MVKIKYKDRINVSIYRNQSSKTAERLFALRQKANLSVRQLVAQLTSGRKGDICVTLSESQYKRIENADGFMNSEILMALCQFYGVTADYILFGETDSNAEFVLNSSEAQTVCSFMKWQIEHIEKKRSI